MKPDGPIRPTCLRPKVVKYAKCLPKVGQGQRTPLYPLQAKVQTYAFECCDSLERRYAYINSN